MIAGGKRKVEVPSNPVEDIPVEGTTEARSSKRQRLMTEYLMDLEAEKPQPQVTEDSSLALDEMGELRRLMLEPSMVEKGTKAMRKSCKRREQAKVLYWKYTNQYRHLATLEDKKMVKAWAKANKVR